MNWLEKLLGESQVNLLRILRRSQQTITSLAARMGLTDNAVRTHIATLRRNGLVTEAGTQRDTGGKPARMYDLSRQGEELFPKAYSTILSELIGQIEARDGKEKVVELLRAVGVHASKGVPRPEEPGARVAAAADALRSLGADIDISRTDTGWRLQGYGCPLSAVTEKRPSVCSLAHALVSEVTQQPVIECCDHTGRPRCAFEILAGPHPTP